MTTDIDRTDWQTIGAVSTRIGTLAIVAPHFAELLAAVWEQRLTTLRDDRIYNYEQHQLGEHWVSADNTDGRDITEEIMLVACDEGVFDVDARFCDHYSDGRMTVCELRIRLHNHDDNERNPT